MYISLKPGRFVPNRATTCELGNFHGVGGHLRVLFDSESIFFLSIIMQRIRAVHGAGMGSSVRRKKRSTLRLWHVRCSLYVAGKVGDTLKPSKSQSQLTRDPRSLVGTPMAPTFARDGRFLPVFTRCFYTWLVLVRKTGHPLIMAKSR